MARILRASRVNLQQIDFSDTTYSLTPGTVQTPPPALLESIGRFGIMHPPVLKESSDGACRVVAGRLRLLAANELQPALSHTCLLLPPDTSEISTLAIGLEDTLLRGAISIMEQAIFFQKALAWIDEQTAAGDFLPRLGHKPHSRMIHELVRLLDLEEPLQHGVHTGLLQEGVARELLTCSFPDRLALFEIIETLRLSVGSQKQLVSSCKELALRNNTSILSILSDAQVMEIRQNQESNPPQKAANLIRILREKCSPRLAEAEQEYRSFVGRLMLPEGVTLQHAPAFERDVLSCTIQFKDRDEFLSQWPAIRQLLG